MGKPIADPDAEEEPEDLQECRTLDGMRIVRIGRGHYRVWSQSKPECAYVVDLSAHDGLGSCECENFAYRLWPRYKKVKKPYSVFRCKHIKRCRDFVLDAIIKHYQDEKSPTHHN